MRILFVAAPAYGHLLPMVALMEAALDLGHQVAVAVTDTMGDLVQDELPAGVVHLPVGPSTADLAGEVIGRLGPESLEGPTAAGIGEFFAGAMLDLAADDAVRAARSWRPDVVVAEMYSALGPLVASTLGIAWHEVRMTVPLPDDWAHAIERSTSSRYTARGLERAAPASVLDLWPESLGSSTPSDGEAVPRHPVRARAHRRTTRSVAGEPVRAPATRPIVLVTLGTAFSDPAVLDAVANAVAENDVDVRVTRGAFWRAAEHAGTDRAGRGEGRITFVEFTPLDELLDDVSVVVSAGGAGTVLGALSRGIPLVLWPQGADQPAVARRVVAAGAGTAVDDVAQVGRAVAEVLPDSEPRRRAASIALGIAAQPTPSEVLRAVLGSSAT